MAYSLIEVLVVDELCGNAGLYKLYVNCSFQTLSSSFNRLPTLLLFRIRQASPANLVLLMQINSNELDTTSRKHAMTY